MFAGLALSLLAALVWFTVRGPNQSPGTAHPSEPSPTAPLSKAPAPDWVDNAQCLSCHASQASQWQVSHHARAMGKASPDTIRADFDNTRFKHQGLNSTFFKKDDRYIVRTDGPDGKTADFDVAYAFGYAPLQQYLIELPGGRLQPLQIAWDAPRARWFHLLPDEKAPPGDVLHWTGRYQTANTMCISCHTTGFEKRYDATADRFDSTWKEPNVSCQSCHGPGQRHVEWASRKADARQDGRNADSQSKGLVVDLRAHAGKAEVEVCSACHSRRSELTDKPVPGEPRLDHYRPALLSAGLYHADGQQLDEVFVDGSYRQSKMYQKGVGCTECHNSHTGKLKADGNAVCTQCHQPAGNSRFPRAKGSFDAASHHFHQPGSAGAQCTACHMPSKTYMQIQARPDHSLRIPRPDLSVSIGTPNACNQCHTDRSAQWAADRVTAWYGPNRRQEPHFGSAFAAARAGRPGSLQAVAAIAADRDQPGIVRASALELLRNEARIGAEVRIEATRDPDPEIRAAAADSLEALPAVQRLNGLQPLLSDPLRAVRIAAARSLSSLPAAQIPAAMRPAFDSALTEFIAAQSVSLDMPGSRLNLGVVYRNTGRIEPAEREFLAALKIDPDFTPARANLAQLYNAQGRNGEALRVLEAGLARLPDLGELQYSLGLLLAEEQRLPEASAALQRAARLMPDRAKVHYNLGLARQQTGNRKAAREALETAWKLDSTDPATAYALAVLSAQSGQRQEAIRWGEAMRALSPADPQVSQFVERLRSGR